ncbi:MULTISPECIES: DUF4123 domain-containing protein [Paraburkholderia]|uniref:DUF4123 domain-containing protein n=1 Tax=Paraburkholderia TaxID=1822464 RepID=UPI0004A7B5B5|nr:DUF4123 domain-containing protein [Paraburkholderia nemoris]CAE6711848.1 hypothetical protein LMG22931_01312 [Paraburkholderia nemoris]
MTVFTYIVVEPSNGELDLGSAPRPFEIGELVPRAKPDLEGVAPWLYRLEHVKQQLPAVSALAKSHRQMGRPPVVCCVLETPADTDMIREHLANALVLKRPDCGTAVFRYYDPRVFAHLHWILNSDQIPSLTGPVTSWSYLSEAGDWLNIPLDGMSVSSLELTTEQFSQLGRLSFVRRALESLKDVFAVPPPADLPRRLDSYLRRAESYGLPSEDRIPFALHGVLVAPNFDSHPKVQAVLADVTQVPYGEAVSNWSDEDWKAIARESMQYQFD